MRNPTLHTLKDRARLNANDMNTIDRKIIAELFEQMTQRIEELERITNPHRDWSR